MAPSPARGPGLSESGLTGVNGDLGGGGGTRPRKAVCCSQSFRKVLFRLLSKRSTFGKPTHRPPRNEGDRHRGGLSESVADVPPSFPRRRRRIRLGRRVFNFFFFENLVRLGGDEIANPELGIRDFVSGFAISSRDSRFRHRKRARDSRFALANPERPQGGAAHPVCPCFAVAAASRHIWLGGCPALGRLAPSRASATRPTRPAQAPGPRL